MKALAVEYDAAADSVTPTDAATQEEWFAVCERFDGDVHRIRDADDVTGYNALYVCYDEDNQPFHFLVTEDAELARARHRVFFSKLGR
ncbi:MAG: hypothetical protein QNJ22_01885 [Desulfosarcinaceae bacterium]|nr:hypothetical protein [Desulfosarcinaceae bacterium]